MNVLIIYATYSGGTLLAAEAIQETLKKQSIDSQVKNVRDLTEEDVKNHSHFIFGSCTWFENKLEGQLHGGYADLIERIPTFTIGNKQCAVYGLGDNNMYAIHFCEAADHLKIFVEDHNGVVVTEPLKIDRFYFEQEENTKKLKDWAEQLPTLFTE